MRIKSSRSNTRLHCAVIGLLLLVTLQLIAADNTNHALSNNKLLRRNNIYVARSSSRKGDKLHRPSLFDELFHDDETTELDVFMRRMTSGSMSMMSTPTTDTCDKCETACLPTGSPAFNATSVDIGGTGVKGETTRCGPNCYILQGAGLDSCANVAVAPTTSDAIYFAYEKVTGPFILAARVCSTKTGSSTLQDSGNPRIGLMVRESLEADAANVFLGHHPSLSAVYSDRNVTGGSTSCGLDFSIDVVCLWHFLQRVPTTDASTPNFIGSYAYEESDCSMLKAVNGDISFLIPDMPEEVYVGLAVQSGSTSATYEGRFSEVHYADALPPTIP